MATVNTRSPLQAAATIVGIVFLAVGVLGFVPGVTSDLGSITFAGHESQALLLGIFQISILHNIVHLLFGVAGVAMARSASSARAYLLVGGVIYLVLWLYGLLIAENIGLNFVPVNTADDWLHLVLGAGMVALALALGRRPVVTAA